MRKNTIRVLQVLFVTSIVIGFVPTSNVSAQSWCAVKQYEGQLGLPADQSSATDLDGDGTITSSDQVQCSFIALEYLNACGFTSDVEAETLPCGYYQQQQQPQNGNNEGGQPQTNIPGLDIAGYCRSIGYDQINIVGTDRSASGLLCVRGSDGATQSLDMNAACVSQFGNGYGAVRTNPSDPYGWSCELVSSPDTSSTTRPTLQAAIARLRVRSGPDVGCEQIGTITPGTEYSIEGKNDGSTWLQITFNGQSGWVSASYATISDPSLMFAVPNTGRSSSCLLLQTMDQISSDPSAELTPEQQEILIARLEQGLRQAGYSAQEASRISREIQYQLLSIGVSCAVPVGVALAALIGVVYGGLEPKTSFTAAINLVGGAFLYVGVDPDVAYQCAAEFVPYFVD